MLSSPETSPASCLEAVSAPPKSSGRALTLGERWVPDTRAQQLVLALPFVGWVLLYFFRFGDTAWHPTDYEHIPSQVWRILNGEVPYRDFVYHKPPGTIWVHTVWFALPDTWQVPASRLFFYAQMATAGALPVLWAVKHGAVRFGFRLPLLAVATTTIALHNFPVTPWQTTDGVFFSVLGLVALVHSLHVPRRKGLVFRALASVLFAFALCCKQSFVLPCVGLAVFAAAEWVYRASKENFAPKAWLSEGAWVLASGLPALVLLGGVFIWLKATDAWPHFLAQFHSQSTGGALWAHLVNIYESPYDRFTLLMWIPVGFLLWVVRGMKMRLAAGIIGLPWLLFVVFWAMAFTAEGQGRLGAVMFMALFGTFLGRLTARTLQMPRGRFVPRPEDNGLLLHAGFVLIALGCQLSLGYNSPILGVFGLGLVIHELLPPERSPWVDILPSIAVVWIVLGAFLVLNDRMPYRDMARSEMTYPLGQVFPKLGFIKTASPNYRRYVDLKRIVEEQAISKGKAFSVLQDYPGIYWLMGTRNPMGIDWAWPPDMRGFDDRFIRELEAARPVAIVPKESEASWTVEQVYPPCEQLSFHRHHGVSRHVVSRWRLVGQNNYFCAFVPP
jgi:hypothetical protein